MSWLFPVIYSWKHSDSGEQRGSAGETNSRSAALKMHCRCLFFHVTSCSCGWRNHAPCLLNNGFLNRATVVCQRKMATVRGLMWRSRHQNLTFTTEVHPPPNPPQPPPPTNPIHRDILILNFTAAIGKIGAWRLFDRKRREFFPLFENMTLTWACLFGASVEPDRF